MNLFLGLVAVASLAVWWIWRVFQRDQARRRAAVAAPPASPAPPVTGEVLAPETLAQALQRLNPAIDAFSDRMGHPRELLECPPFLEAVERLADPAVPIDTLRQHALGGNWVPASAALEALSRRKDGAEAFGAVINRFGKMPAWPAHFALVFFDSLQARPPAGAPAVFASDWWGNNPNLLESFRDSFVRRQALGDAPDFGDWLERPGAQPPAEIDAFLSLVDHPYAAALVQAVRRAAAAKLNRTFLQSFGRFWDKATGSGLIAPQPWSVQLEQAVKAVQSSPARSVIVSGEPRVGKSAFLRLVGRTLANRGWTVFEASGAELMAGQIYFGELEGRVRQTVAELDAGKKVAWCVGDILALAESGTHKGQAASLLEQILPAVVAGRLVILGEISPQGLNRLLQSRPSLRTQMEFYRLEPLAEDVLAALAQELVTRMNGQPGPKIEPAALEAALQFSHQYFSTAPTPGVVSDVLKRARQHAAAAGAPTAGVDAVIGALSQITGLPAMILDDRAKVDLAALRAFFAGQVMGQEEAVSTVVDRIAMLKAGLTDPNRPVGVFLFAGPTGTGKTELAKTLAEHLFGSASRMARLDMSEFQNADSTVKILGERGRSETDSLVERVRKQPFSVILLDEFEKAHPNVWDLFLQVFDDGRLTDANGYGVDFRHTIIILTSNLGATSHKGSGLGFNPSKGAYGDEQVLKAVAQTFRPEFVNRLDKVVVFKPLSRELMAAILKKELAQVLDRRGLRNRDWAVEWEPSALEFLLDRGFSPEMGARPLKRAIDQHLLAPLAATLVEHRFPEGDQFLFVRSNGTAIEVEFVDPDLDPDLGETGEAAAGAAPGPGSLADMILQPAGSPEERAALAAAEATLAEELDSPEWSGLKARLAAEAADEAIWSRADRHAVFARYALMDRVEEAARTAASLNRRLSGTLSRELVQRLALQIHLVGQGIGDVWEDAPVEAILAVEGALDSGPETAGQTAWLARLEAMYRGWAERGHMQFDLVAPPKGKTGPTLLKVAGFGAFRTLAAEIGLHVLEEGADKPAKRTVARVRVAAGPAEDPVPARAHAVLLARLGAPAEAAAVVRRYRDAPSPLIRDARAGWRSGRAAAVFAGDFDLIGLAEAG